MCNCVNDAINKIEEHGYSSVKAPVEFLSGRLYLEFTGVKNGQKKEKAIPVLLSKCPFCGESMVKEVAGNES